MRRGPYHLLLVLFFPRRVRREFGDDMARMFAAQLAGARASGTGVARLWLLALLDAVVHGSAERWRTVSDRRRRFVRAIRHWRWGVRAVRQDVKYAFGMMRRQPGLTLTAVLTLALGIGANTAIFSAVDAVLLRPLPYAEPDRLMMVWEKREAEGVFDNAVAPADFVDWAQMNTVFDSMAALPRPPPT